MTCGWAFDAFPQTRSGSEALTYPPRRGTFLFIAGGSVAGTAKVILVLPLVSLS
jgi:hypothetical protein